MMMVTAEVEEVGLPERHVHFETYLPWRIERFTGDSERGYAV